MSDFTGGRSSSSSRLSAYEMRKVADDHERRCGRDALWKWIDGMANHFGACALARAEGRPDPKRGDTQNVNGMVAALEARASPPSQLNLPEQPATTTRRRKRRTAPTSATSFEIASQCVEDFKLYVGGDWSLLDDDDVRRNVNTLFAVWGADHVCAMCVTLDVDADGNVVVKLDWNACGFEDREEPTNEDQTKQEEERA